MRVPLAVSAAALLAVAAAACSGGQATNYVAPPAAGSFAAVTAGGPVTLSNTATVESAGTANGITGALTFGAGTGTVTSVSSATAPFGTTTVVPASKRRVVFAVATTSPTSPNVYYVTITSPTGATLSGLPGVSLSFTTPAVGTYQEAEWNGTAYMNVTGATATVNASGTAVSFPAGSTAVTIPANGSIYLAFYQGTYPNATPTPLATPTNVIADSDFSSPATAAPIGSAVTSTGWSVCTITAVSPLASASPPGAISTYSTTGTVPGAAIEAAGTAVPQGTKTPAPLTAVPASPPSGYAAVFGGLFNNYTLANYGYNGFCQTVKIPNNAVGTLQVLASGTENSLSYFNFDVDILDTNGAYVSNLVYENQIAKTPPGDSTYRTITIPATTLQPYAGQTVQLFVGIWTKAGSSSNSMLYSGYYFVDLFTLSGVPL